MKGIRDFVISAGSLLDTLIDTEATDYGRRGVTATYHMLK